MPNPQRKIAPRRYPAHCFGMHHWFGRHLAIAVTEAHGALHRVAPGRYAGLGKAANEFDLTESDFLDAARLARDLGFALDPTLEALFGSIL